ncbi:MAG: uroporphyrinogen decarboxylase [Deltaproteobacteria bacterium]|jgi:uroporphyrinogen decarboxylase|nr:uroporphyrinogen decarboxylase [Deltaproteobacteria bacterium]
MSRADRFLAACRGEQVDTTPIWVMRQAGRYMPEYRALRERHSFLTMCRTPELACEVTLQPLEAFELDAGIIFSDILVVIEAMGSELSFGEGVGPRIANPVRDRAGLDQVRAPEVEEDLGYVLEAIRMTRAELAGKVPLIGFAGAPFTLASYMVEGGSSKDMARLKGRMMWEPVLFGELMERLATTTAAFLRAQIDAGAQAVQLFDTWAGLLAPEDFTRHVMPHVRRIVREVRGHGAPVVYFVNGCAGLLDQLAGVGADVIGVDWRVSLDRALTEIGEEAAVQGNLDPCALFGPIDEVRRRAGEIIDLGRRARGHVFNLGHGVLPQTDPAMVGALVDAVHELGRRGEQQG